MIRPRQGPMRTWCAAGSFSLVLSVTVVEARQDPVADPGIGDTLQAFIAAFNDLDLERFIGLFADDATLFHPPAAPPRTFPDRITGRDAIARSFDVVFDQIEARSDRTSPPYMALDPRDVHIQQFDRTAVVTFHLDTGANTARGRRTVVLHQADAGWTIVHLHASAFTITAEEHEP